jgi:hypothetical protein
VHRIDTAERRARLVRRHGLSAKDRAGDAVDAARRVVGLHATDPTTVYISAWARVEGLRIGDVERALYEERSLVKHMAMRRTLFAFPRELLPAAQAGASDRVAASERKRLIAQVERTGLHADGESWLDGAEAEVFAALAGGREATSTELREEIPALVGEFSYGEGKPWAGTAPVGPRVLTTLSAAGRLFRASNDGRWTTSRPRWATARTWLGGELEPPDAASGAAALVERWLAAFGPGTEDDVRWWLGSTKTDVRRALKEVGAVEVALDGGASGYVLPGDLETTESAAGAVALLPCLDPTTMGWSERGWYLGPHRDRLFDRNGNAGATAWLEGRVVGGWRQREGGEVELQLLGEVPAAAEQALEEEAARLETWLDGTRIAPRYPSPLSKE